MISLLPAGARGSFDHGWLQTQHSFSFAGFYKPDQMGFRSLRVINEDVVQPGRGFGRHPHRDMEILTYVIRGALRHEDSEGHASILRAGSFQRMTAGSGIRHSEMNASATEPVHLLQIWILPERKGLAPSYEELHDTDEERRGRLRLIASPEGGDGILSIHQDARVFSGIVDPRAPVELEVGEGRHLWLQVVRGDFEVEGQSIAAGDGLALSEITRPSIIAGAAGGELLVFDLA